MRAASTGKPGIDEPGIDERDVDEPGTDEPGNDETWPRIVSVTSCSKRQA